MTVTILGASPNPKRYSFLVRQELLTQKMPHYLVNPHWKSEDPKVYSSLMDLPEPPQILTVYVNPEISTALLPEILDRPPRVVVFNPGSESAPVRRALVQAGVHVLEACSLVLLRTGQWESLTKATR